MRKINDRYEFDPQTDELGKGGFGRVFKARDTLLSREVVMKIVQKDNLPDKYSLVQEISRVIDFNHPNLVRYYDAVIIKDVNNFGEEVEYQIGIMEYMRNGDLRAFIKTKPTEPQIRQIITGTLKGLGYLHDHGLIHRDIKPPNILLNIDHDIITAKICDFGISKMVGSEATALSNVIGTFEYMSPEQLGSNADQKINTNSDLWSIGVLIYEMFMDELPFGSRRSGTTDAKIIGNILAAPVPEKIVEIPQPYRQMIEVCLNRESDKRVSTSAELLSLLEKPQVTPEKTKPTLERINPLVSVIPPRTAEPQLQAQPIPPVSQEQLPAEKTTAPTVTVQAEDRKFRTLTWIWFLSIIPAMILFAALFENMHIMLIGDRPGLSGVFFGGIVMFIAGRVLHQKFQKPITGAFNALFMVGSLGLLEFIAFITGMIILNMFDNNEYFSTAYSIIPFGLFGILAGIHAMEKNHPNMGTGGIVFTSVFMALVAALAGANIGSDSPSSSELAFALPGIFIFTWIVLAALLIRNKSASKYLWFLVRTAAVILLMVAFFYNALHISR
ncbi:MAG: serine/threonine-protein kinase [Bacteroidia bacterium]